MKTNNDLIPVGKCFLYAGIIGLILLFLFTGLIESTPPYYKGDPDPSNGSMGEINSSTVSFLYGLLFG